MVVVIAGVAGCGLGFLAIVGLGAGTTVLQAASARVREGEDRKARVDLLTIRLITQEYAILQGGRFPESLSELDQWLLITGGVRPTLDPWGSLYQYVPPTNRDPVPRVISLGSDGQPGGTGQAADIDDETAVRAEER